MIVLVHTANAHYDPNIGRWISREPIYENGGLNLCEFVGNNGVNLLDPRGLEFYAAFVPAWWELNDGNDREHPGIIPGEGKVKNDSTTELYLRQGQRVAEESRKKSEKNIRKLQSMSDEEWNRLTSHGFSVRWINSFQSAPVTRENYSGRNVNASLIVKDGVSRKEVLRWLRNEKGSFSEIFITGSPDSILKRVVQRASEELSSSYEWTSFALTIHSGKSGLNFPTGGVPVQMGRDAAASVKARQSDLITCGANARGVVELIMFTPMDLAIDEDKCSAIFTPAQVTRGMERSEP